MDWTLKDNMVKGLFHCATLHKPQKGFDGSLERKGSGENRNAK